MLTLPKPWIDHFGSDEGAWFARIFALNGDEYRNMDGRRTLRFELLGQSYFVKMYQGLGWGRIFKSLVTLRKPPVLTAYNEWLAIRILTELGIDTMSIVAYGERGRNPALKQSFLVTEDLQNTQSLEQITSAWKDSAPSPGFKRALLSRIAEVTRTLHKHGINHRDYYLCHFLLDISNGIANINPHDFKLYLIDLHRVQFRKKVPLRWKIKDLASLYFSTFDCSLTRRDCYRFMCLYTSRTLRETLKEDAGMWNRVERRSMKLYARYLRKYAA